MNSAVAKSEGQAFDAFLNSLRAPESRMALSPERLADALDVSAQKIASMARVHRNTVSLAPASPKLQAAMGDVIRALSAAHELTGDVDQALFWFKNKPIAVFNHLTPMQLVENGRVEALISYIQSLSAGPAG